MSLTRLALPLALPLALWTAACGAAPEELPDAERPEMNEDALVLAEGTFQPKVHQAKGALRLEEDAGARRVLFMDDFEIDNGPALIVFFSTNFARLFSIAPRARSSIGCATSTS